MPLCNDRLPTAAAAAHAGAATVVHQLELLRQRAKRDALRAASVIEKGIDEQIEGYQLTAEQLDSFADMCLAPERVPALQLALDSAATVCELPGLMTARDLFGTVLVSSASDVHVSALSTICSEWICGRKTACTGTGLFAFAHGCMPAAAIQNSFVVKAVDTAGKPALYIQPSDVVVSLSTSRTIEGYSLSDPGTTVTTKLAGPASPGCVLVSFEVLNSTVRQLQLSVTVCGVELKSGPWWPQAGYTSKSLRTLAVAAGAKTGLAVSADGCWLALGVATTNEVHLHSMPAGTLARRVGGEGEAAGRFNHIAKMCFTSSNALLVCDRDNDRVQEFTVQGSFIRAIPTHRPVAVAVTGSIVAVGASGLAAPEANIVDMFDYATGAHIRGFRYSDLPGCNALRFSADGDHILAVSNTHTRVHLFDLDGRWQGLRAGAVLGRVWDDFVVASNQSVVVCGSGSARLGTYFEGRLENVWGSEGTEDRQFMAPSALATLGSNLYVADETPRVQVFE